MADSRQFEKLRSALGPAADCPPLEQLAMALDAARDDPRRQAAETHTAACSSCRDELALLREFVESSPRPEEARSVNWIAARLAKQRVFRPSKQRVPFFFGVRAWAAAACLMVVAAGAFYLPRGPGAPSSSGIGDGVMRSSRLELLAPVGDVTEPPAALRWRAVPGAALYRVRLMEVDRREVWKAETADDYLPIPSTVLALMPAGRTLLWEVSAADKSGKALGASDVRSFRVVVNR